MIEQILISILSSLTYSFIFYIKKREQKDSEDFNKFKLASTLLVGVMVGAVFGYRGIEVRVDTIETFLAANIGIIAIVESILKALYRRFIKNSRNK